METKPLEIRDILSKNIKQQRKKLGFTLEKLSELTGLAVQTINDIEGGRRWVSDKTITKLSTALHIESYQLLIADYFSQNRKKDSPTQQLLELKKNILKNVDSQIEVQFNNFFKAGTIEPELNNGYITETPSQHQTREETVLQKPIRDKPKQSM